MDRAHHRAVRVRHSPRIDLARRTEGDAQPGALWLARTTGNPVLPFHAEASRAWTLGSWDRTQIPKPFSAVALVVGEPLEVAPDATDVQLERARLDLESRLGALERRARELI